MDTSSEILAGLPSYTPRKTQLNDEVQINLYKSDKSLPSMPYQLHEIIPEMEFEVRMKRLKAELNMWWWHSWDTVFVVLASLITTAVPLVFAILFNHKLLSKIPQIDKDISDDPTASELPFEHTKSVQNIGFVARSAGLGVLFGCVILIWLPFLTYKHLMSKRINELLDSFSHQDLGKRSQIGLRWWIYEKLSMKRQATIIIRILPLREGSVDTCPNDANPGNFEEIYQESSLPLYELEKLERPTRA